jgi:glutaredoxin/uncharacterized membrane protein
MRVFVRVVLPLLLAIYIGVETVLKLQHSSLCSSTGCKMAGELLKFNSIYLNIFGFIGVLAILFVGWRSLKNPVWEKLFFVIAYSAVAFETIMIAFQIFVNPEPCKFCMGVWSGLLAIAILAKPKQFVYFLPILLAIFSALSMLNIPKNEHLVSKDGVYLIHSNRCPHCKKVKKYFKEHNITYRGIETPSTTARFFANTLNIHQIPIALIKKAREIRVIYGDEPIIEYFEAKNSNKTQKEEKETKNINPFKSEDEGCGFDLIGGDSGCSGGN